ncbi:hypothetical protein ISTM_193 [Insectomime virus]|uniref:Uncharacterized protein n=1 Tax=Tunisvirus fontaine2 TaxID=1421067 RepID=V9SG32_9VIRU|nr:hypothetical protein D1R32_gp127 [Tunisvirus fontaine2]AHA46091.1 hypothetical protein ISTM_193 [Insectomime virus]AHC54844.1 hypothetical protein TNS_ORF126 [Tunisvirus fontaine2]
MEELEDLAKLLQAMRDISEKNISKGEKLLKRVRQESSSLCSELENPQKAEKYLLQNVEDLWSDSKKVVVAHKEFLVFLTGGEKPKRNNFLMEAWKGDLYGKKGAPALRKLCKNLLETQSFLEQPYEDVISQIL